MASDLVSFPVAYATIRSCRPLQCHGERRGFRARAPRKSVHHQTIIGRSPKNRNRYLPVLVQTPLCPTRRLTARSPTHHCTAVLDWSKLDAGSVQAESIDFNLRNIVESATVTVGHIAQAKSVEIVVENSVETDPKWALLGDPHRFRQCLLNILSNALKFTPLSQRGSRPKIQIRWVIDERPDSSVEITVAIQDEGIGIPRKAMNKLFGAFVQVDVGTARNYGGTGLGKSADALRLPVRC